ncbi:FUSC family protein [Sphingomonas desiccabilis]|nr:FUSC family protein [Sphingomonas desiccabilis]MBB3910570.1 putative membrane protein YccC [Sphingomonas desiccabilis]
MTIGVRQLVFSANAFAGALLALFLSFAIGLERPFWAMVTVYIASQPLSGASVSKGVFRLIGTAVGAGAAVVMVPAFVNAPVLLTLVMALWVGGCLFVSLLDRTPRSYLFMLAGYTAAFVGFPAAGHPEQVFGTAVLRAQEIGLGVFCAMLFHSIVFPLSVGDAVRDRLRDILADAERWTADALAGIVTPETEIERRRLANDTTELHLLGTHLPYDTARVRPERGTLAALQDRLVLLLPMASAMEDRIITLRSLRALPERLERLVEDVRCWVKDPAAADPDALRDRAEQLSSDAARRHDWEALLQANLAGRLGELVVLLVTIRSLARAIRFPDEKLPEGVRQTIRAARPRKFHLDHALALRSAFATVLAIVGCATFWIFSGWPDGATATMIAAVMCCFFAAMDDPTVAQRGFLYGTAAGIPIVGLYLFAILPMISGFPLLALALAPLFLPLGVAVAFPALAGATMPLVVGIAGGLALNNNYGPSDFATFVNSNFALCAGVLAAIFATRLVRVLDPAAAVLRVLRAGWRDLADAAEGRAIRSPADWTSRMLDRVGLILPRLPRAAADLRLAGTDALRDLRVGLGVLQVREAARTTPAGAGRAEMERLVATLGRHFRRLGNGASERPPLMLLGEIDTALALVLEEPTEMPGREPTLHALVGLRRNLFPDASAWQPEALAA